MSALLAAAAFLADFANNPTDMGITGLVLTPLPVAVIVRVLSRPADPIGDHNEHHI